MNATWQRLLAWRLWHVALPGTRHAQRLLVAPLYSHLNWLVHCAAGELPWWDQLTDTRVWVTGMDGLCGVVSG